ncbi:MAG: hypothetical protein ACMXYA_02590 [Candidatus Woesearchaeota archaeon]
MSTITDKLDEVIRSFHRQTLGPVDVQDVSQHPSKVASSAHNAIWVIASPISRADFVQTHQELQDIYEDVAPIFYQDSEHFFRWSKPHKSLAHYGDEQKYIHILSEPEKVIADQHKLVQYFRPRQGIFASYRFENAFFVYTQPAPNGFMPPNRASEKLYKWTTRFAELGIGRIANNQYFGDDRVKIEKNGTFDKKVAEHQEKQLNLYNAAIQADLEKQRLTNI